MNMLEKIELLMSVNNIKNKMQLAQHAKIPYSTLTSMYSKGYEKVKLPTIQALCDVLNCSLDYLCNDFVTDPNYGKVTHELNTSESLTSTERENLKKYRALDEHGKELVDLILNKEYVRVQDAPAQEEQELTPELIRDLIQKEKQRGRLAAFGGFSTSVEMTEEERDQIFEILKKNKP